MSETLVPKALRAERRWITWRVLDGRKPPCRVDEDGHARPDPEWNTPGAWSTYEEAVARFATCEELEGVGFVLGDGWTGLDLDKCRDPKTGELDPRAEAVLEEVPTAYAEVSPSEEGVKVFGRGDRWLELAFQEGRVEVREATSGYFCVTGAQLDPSRTELPELPLDVLASTFGARSRDDEGERAKPLPEEGGAVAPGGQEVAMFREACALRNRGYQEAEIAQALWGLVQAGRFPNEPGREPWTFAHCQDKARSACRYEVPERVERTEELPTIVVSADLVGVVEEAVEAVGARGGVYVRARQLVAVARDGTDPKNWLKRPPGSPVIVRHNEVTARELLARSASWASRKKDGDLSDIMPPTWVAKHLINRASWPFPYLEQVVETPCFLPDGRVLSGMGHDEASGVLLEPLRGVEWPEVSQAPTKDDAGVAVKTLLEPVVDFPFVAPSDEAAYVSAVLSLVGRMAVEGPVPMFPIRAKAPASGKGLLAAVVGIIGTGRSPAVGKLGDADELRKRVTSVALAGTPLVLLDDLSGSLGSDVLAAALTATTWEDRILGASEMTSLPLRVVWLATGNNLGFQRTLGRRVVPIDLDAKMEHPEDRTDFKIKDLQRWVRLNRPRLVGAALTLLRAFHVAGRPHHGKPRMGSFEAWDDLVRSAVVWVMGVDPAGAEDQDSARGRIRATADDDLADMRTLLDSLRERYENRAWTAADAWNRADTDRPLRLAMDTAAPGRGGRPASLSTLRYKLRSLEGRPCGDLTLTRVRSSRETLWAVLRGAEDPGPRDSRPEAPGSQGEF